MGSFLAGFSPCDVTRRFPSIRLPRAEAIAPRRCGESYVGKKSSANADHLENVRSPLEIPGLMVHNANLGCFPLGMLRDNTSSE
ncbi:hypothetical protein RRG08_040367 [Elysia crispata]|uniref:Uncharacterized protein n=1 Tax=Elysia crispata TaxID=231223 RepID=A0AAE1A1Q4_9GAST|nr:hypothetical protein RRG08_040367 [Elysia crispata]